LAATGLALGVLMELIDLPTGFTRSFAANHSAAQQYTDFPSMFFIFTAAAIIVETVYRFFIIPFLLWVFSNLILKGRAQAPVLRKENPIDYPVMALEGLWWVEDGEFDINQPGNWRWTAMIMQPDHITPEIFQEALDQMRKKKPGPALEKLRFETFNEGLSIQIMHVGPYADEPASIQKMNDFARDNGYALRGRHHEIYLGDPRRADPAKLKTVLRHPVQGAAGSCTL
jgi:hypothetical protein